MKKDNMPNIISAHIYQGPRYVMSKTDMTRSCVKGKTERVRRQYVMNKIANSIGDSTVTIAYGVLVDENMHHLPKLMKEEGMIYTNLFTTNVSG